MEYLTTAPDAESAYIRDVVPIHLLSYEDEVNLARAARKGDQHSRQEMIRHNLRLVMGLARKYRNRGIDYMDLVEEGNIGLIRAVDKYDPERGYRFSTYATWWIRQCIERAIMNHARDVRLPVHIIKQISYCLRQEGLLRARLGRKPGRSELAAFIPMPLAELEGLLDCHESSYDYGEPMPELDSIDLAKGGCATDQIDPADQTHHHSRCQTLRRWLSALNQRQRDVVVRRYGLDGFEATTLENVGEDVGLTRERVRQLQLDAVRRLRRMASAEGYDISAFF